MSAFTLADLERIVAHRAASADTKSYTASLYAKGIGKASQKLGEEAVETVIAAVSRRQAGCYFGKCRFALSSSRRSRDFRHKT